MRLMDEYHIDQAVLLYPTSDAHLNMGGWQAVCKIYNQKIAEVSQGPSRSFYREQVFCRWMRPLAIKEELKRIKDLGLKILSLASSYEGKYLDDPLFDEVFEFAASQSICPCTSILKS